MQLTTPTDESAPMRFHEYANLFPMMQEMDLMRLAGDIMEKGQSDPIITFEGQILDGRNRFKACEFNNIAPKFVEYAGSDPLGFVISHNLHRRHLTESQRAMVAARLATMKSGSRTDLPSIDGRLTVVKSQESAADSLNVGMSTLQRAKKIQRDGSPELNAAVESGELTVGAAYKVAELPHEEQDALVSEGVGAVKAKAKEIRETPKDPEPEPEPLVIDGTKPAQIPKWIPDDADRLWLLAKQDLNKILPTDKSREKVLLEIISYAQNRIQTNK